MSSKNKDDQVAKKYKKVISGIKQINQKLFDMEVKIDTIEYRTENKSFRFWRIKRLLLKIAIAGSVALQLVAIIKYIFGL